MRIAFITSRALPTLYEDDRLAATALRQRGHEVSPLVWTDAERASLEAFDAVVMRSPWDWFEHRARFRAFLELLATARTSVVNRPSVLLEFADKTYLPRLASRGFDVVPTVQLTRESLGTVPRLLSERGWDRAVLKPAFTANAVGAHRFDAADAGQAVEAAQRGDDEPWLLQPFVPAIAEGELSFVFFGDRFSHAVKKRPPSGEWRVQHEYGGTSLPVEVTQREIDQAAALLAGAAEGTVYARVDVVPMDGRLHLMELELVEPELFFRHEPSAPERFAEALLAHLED